MTWNDVREFLLLVAQIALYPILLTVRVITRLVLLLATILPIGLPLLAVPFLHDLWPGLDAFTKHRYLQPIIVAVTFLVAAGLFAWVFQVVVKYAASALGDFWDLVRKVLRREREGPRVWLPYLKIRQSLVVTWKCNIAKIFPNAWDSLKAVWRLTGIVLAVSLLSLVAYPLFERPVQTVDRYVAVVDVNDTKDTEPERVRVIKLYMRSGALFSLVHADDAQPKEGQGICLGDPQQAWLEQFRIAIANCVKERGGSAEPGADTPLVFKVTAYASIAPMHIGGNTSESAKLNCKVANWRAQAVGAFLADPSPKKYPEQWRCEDVKPRFNKLPSECGGDELNSHYDGKDADGNEIRVDVHRWATPEQMFDGRPADDGTRPDKRRFAVEILNRVVHIELPKGFYREDPP